MKRFLLILSALVCCQLAFSQGSDCFSTKGEKPFCKGESLTFSLMYKWGAVNTEVATASLDLTETTLDAEPVFHTRFGVKSAPFFDIFFKMREDFQGWFSSSTLEPRKFVRDTYEGGYTATNLYLYDWKSGVIHADIQFNGQPRQVMNIPLHGCVQDLPSLVYNLRTLDMEHFQKGEKKPLKFAIDDTVFDIRITYKGKETLKVRKMGKMLTHHFSCSVVSGAMFEGDTELQVWFSADDNQIPVAVMAPLRWGAVWAWLRTYKGLKSEFSARQ